LNENTRNSMVKLIIPPLVICSILFYFSSQTYQQQTLIPYMERYIPNSVNQSFLNRIVFDYHGKEISIAHLGRYYFIEFFIRKAAHLCIYFLLGCFTFRAVTSIKKISIRSLLISLFLVCLYASLDEFHQKITGDRTPLVSDVILDTIGGLLGILFFILLIRKKKRV
jgi:VanZ family protein